MTEQEFLAALPPPGAAEATIVLPDAAAEDLANNAWAFCRIAGAATHTKGRAGAVLRTWRGRLTTAGAQRLAQLQQGGPT